MCALQSFSILKILSSIKSQLQSSLNNPPRHPSVPVYLTLFPPTLVPFHGRDSLLDSTPKLGKALF